MLNHHPEILEEMEQFVVWCDVVRESTHVVDPAAVVSTNIVEVRPLEDRPRRLFVEGGVAAIDEGDSRCWTVYLGVFAAWVRS